MSVQGTGPLAAGSSAAKPVANARRSRLLNPLTALATARALAAGDKARDERRWPEAVEAYGKALQSKPGAAPLWMQYGHCLKEAGRIGDAGNAYLEALALEPTNPDTLLHLGRVKGAMGDAASAVGFLERAVASPALGADPRLRSDASSEILTLGDRARDERRWADAVAAYEAHLRIQPEAGPIWVQLGHCLKESGQSEAAETAYLRGLEFDPDNSDVLLHLGRLRLIAGDFGAAAYYLERAAEAASPNEDARAELRDLLLSHLADFSAGATGDETDWLDDLLDHSQSFGSGKRGAKFWSDLGDRLEANSAQAERAYRKSVELDPDNFDTLLRLSRIGLARDDIASAAQDLEQAEALLPAEDAAPDEDRRTEAAELALRIADRARETKRWLEAVEAYRRSLRIRPGVAKTWLRISGCLDEAGKAAEAESAYAMAAELAGEPVSAEADDDRRLLNCKLCGGVSRVVFGLPHNKKAGHPIPDEPDDCMYYQCDDCNFLFTPALDLDDHTEIYDEEYWNKQDPDWYGRVSQTLRLVAMANEMLQKRLDQIEILDFGSGAGAFVQSGRTDLGLNVWGTDIIAPHLGKDWFLADLGERKFDVITCCEVIEHLPNPREVFAKIRRHLKSPGVFAFQTAWWDPAQLGRDWWYLGPHNGHISLYSREGLAHVFKDMGGAERRMWNDYPGCQAWLFR
ncbi:tetratricopeptide repeat protein [Roseiarcus fermentans]|uniref:Tetratricopeptide repeat protein n=1 Tax=Roseiarcus fermentans TaxID=1473586 RepID=A0A366FMW8_9HYPH|nr:tetratricopeptide repeat protein [Roseiarcus fermentans]RBP15911.1 tetratricopeptide repeat protein [Roseiarcus fermentans]